MEMYQEVGMMEGVEIVDHSHTRAAAGLKHLCLLFKFKNTFRPAGTRCGDVPGGGDDGGGGDSRPFPN